MRRLLTEFATEPVYNMKAVEQQTGISAPTLRAWERRYNLIEPQRTESGYRLYSERDIALLLWVRKRIDEGLTVGRIAAILDGMRNSGEPVVIDSADSSGQASSIAYTPVSPSLLVMPLYDALIAIDETQADQVLERAFAIYTMPTVYIEIIAPALVEIGEAWHRGQILISTEHFATTYLRGRLLKLMQAYPNHGEAPAIFVGCAPRENHELGALILAVILRQEGFNVTYFGQDMPTEDLIQTAKQVHPVMICMSANSPATAVELSTLEAQLNAQVPAPVPLLVYGGRAFDQSPELRESIPGHYLGSDPRQSVSAIREMLRVHRG